MTEKRRPLTRNLLATLILEQAGKCAACGSKLNFAKKGQVVDEHRVPLFSGGTNDTDNRELRCKPCATVKTSAEAPDRAKVRRIEGKKTQADRRSRAKAEGTYRPIQSRGFDKTRTRRMDGTVRVVIEALKTQS